MLSKNPPETKENDKNFSSTIDDFDRQLLYQLDLNCRRSTVEIADVLSRSRQTVEYRIKRLQQLGVITGFNTIFNVSNMGLNSYKLFLKLRDIPQEYKLLDAYLFEHGKVYWRGKSSGSWDLMFSVFYRSKEDILGLINELSLRFSKIIVEIQGNEVYDIWQFPKNYLTRAISSAKEHTGAKVSDEKFDPIDTKIIAQLVPNARIPVNTLAKNIDCNPALVRRRIDTLESNGVIVQYRIGVDLEKLGLQFYKAIFPLNGYTNEEHARFFAHLSTIPEVQFYVRNYWSLEIELIATSYDYYQNIIDDLKRVFPRLLGDYDTLLVTSDEWSSAFRDFLRVS